MKISKNLSIYLDLLRVLAAFAVFVAHSSSFVFPYLRYVNRHSSEAVACFFVLSGFLIMYAAANRERNAADYFIARAARIYPVVIAALICVPIVDYIGLHSAPSRYYGASYFNDNYMIHGILNFFFLNEIWYTHSIYGSSEPFWSLGFEVPYYIIFGIFLFSSGASRVALLAGAILVFGPKILLYMPLWLIGVATYHAVKIAPVYFKSSRAWCFPFFLTTPIYVLFKNYYGAIGIFHFLSDPNVTRTWLYYMGIGILISVNIICFSLIPSRNGLLQKIGPAIKWIAGGTFTLYLLHQSILVMFSTFAFSRSLLGGATAMAATLVICFAIAEVAERPKNLYRDAIRFLFRQPSRKRETSKTAID